MKKKSGTFNGGKKGNTNVSTKPPKANVIRRSQGR